MKGFVFTWWALLIVLFLASLWAGSFYLANTHYLNDAKVKNLVIRSAEASIRGLDTPCGIDVKTFDSNLDKLDKPRVVPC